MSLDKWNPTEEERDRKSGEVLDDNDRNLIEVKTKLNGYI